MIISCLTSDLDTIDVWRGSATYMKVMQDNLDALFYAAAGIWTFAALLALWLVPAEMPASDPPEQEKEGAIARTA
jgi:hypothetical protein